MCINAISIFDSKIKGYVKFHQCKKNEATLVKFKIQGLKPNNMNACHIHEYGDLLEGCKSLGSHWNPTNTNHGYTNLSIGFNKKNKNKKCQSHAGDLLNNIKSDSYGKFYYKYLDYRINLFGDVSESIIGRSVVLHAGEDDLGLGNNEESLKTGNSGERIAFGIIGISKS